MFVVVGRVSQLVGGFVCQRVLFQGVVGVVDVVVLLVDIILLLMMLLVNILVLLFLTMIVC